MRELSRSLARRNGEAKQEVQRLTEEIAQLARASMGQAKRLLVEAKVAAAKAGRRSRSRVTRVIAELEATGHPVRHVAVMSGFRTPQYNAAGGNTSGRAELSRHMYGDASDVFVDNDGDGRMDDLNHDGRVDMQDAEVSLQAGERVEQKYPSLIGGVGAYSASAGHGPFTHIDVRGYRARWRRFGNG